MRRCRIRYGDNPQDKKEFQTAQRQPVVESQTHKDQDAPQGFGLAHRMGAAVEVRKPDQPEAAHSEKGGANYEQKSRQDGH